MASDVVRTREELRAALGDAHPGLVPTMGALHAGHESLIARSASENSPTVVSIFVNPTQFSNRDDLARYPRDLAQDIARAQEAGADLIFAPDLETIYPPGFDTAVDVGDVSERWEGASRPGHFRGVATVVTILLNLVQPARSYFGEKDYQQLQVIRRLHHDLALPGIIVGCPTVRDPDGLALSSRNARLSREDRIRALALPRAIETVVEAAASGETETRLLEAAALSALDLPGVTVDYLALVDGSSLEPLPRLRAGARLLIAADVGGTRLIDNAAIESPGGSQGSSARQLTSSVAK
ncbi:MAG: pantoate--beta-alanine ligase [Chloroflexi bacterium]|nr:pantoate--beta-alanine ligase [Chloroflexota bacterium]